MEIISFENDMNETVSVRGCVSVGRQQNAVLIVEAGGNDGGKKWISVRGGGLNWDDIWVGCIEFDSFGRWGDRCGWSSGDGCVTVSGGVHGDLVDSYDCVEM